MLHTKRIYHSIITGLLILFVGSVTSATSVRNYDTFSQDIGQTLGTLTAPNNTTKLVTIFCDTQYHQTQIQRHDTGDGMITSHLYNAKESLFMMMLCDGEEEKNEFFQHTQLTDYGLDCQGSIDGDNCSQPLYSMIHNIYNHIVSDIVDSMTAQAYGYPGFTLTGATQDNKLAQASEAFLYTYGDTATRTTLCEKNDCGLPQTRQTLQQYLKSARQLSQKRKRLQQTFPKDTIQNCLSSHKKDGSYTILACGLTADAPLTHQHNLITNELIRYTVFVNYYSYQLTHNPQIQPTVQSSNINKLIEQGTTQATELLRHHQAATQATHQSMQYIGQLRSTFPTHIYLTAYYEMIKKVRDHLARLYTPLHQLYYKLRNVQAQS